MLLNCFLFIFLSIFIKVESIPQTGNSDYGLIFTGHLGHFVVSEKILNHPTEEFTWVMWGIMNPGNTGRGGVLYSAGSRRYDAESTIPGTNPLQGVVLGHYTQTGSIPISEWKMYIFRWSSKTGKQEMFVDYEKVISEVNEDLIGAKLSSEVWLLLGQDSDEAPPVPPWDKGQETYGVLDELLLWDRIVEIDEIKEIEQNGFNLSSSQRQGLISWWPFKEGNGFITKDVIGGVNLYLGGDDVLIDFVPGGVPGWIVSSAPIYKNEFTSSYVLNKETLIEIPFKENGEEVLFKHTSLPSQGKIFKSKEKNGVLVVGNEITKVPTTVNSGKFWILVTVQLSETLKLDYEASDTSGNSVTGQIQLHSNQNPIAYSYYNTTKEDTLTTLRILTYDPDGDSITIKISSLPSNGDLYHYSENQTSLTKVKEGDVINDEPERRILYLSSPNASGKYLSNFTYLVEDKHSFSNQGTITITVDPVSDTPSAPDIRITTLEDSSILIDFSNVTDLDPSDFLLNKHLISLPQHGSIFQYHPEYGKGSQIFTLSGPPIENPTQYATQVVDFSTEFNWLGEWSANDSLGPPDCFDEYCDASPHGDCPKSWCPSTQSTGIDGNGLEYMELLFDTPIYLKGVEIYENLNPGSVFKVEAVLADTASSLSQTTTNMLEEQFLSLDNILTSITTTVSTTTINMTLLEEMSQPLNQSTGRRITVWEGEPQDVIKVARVFRPPICETYSKVQGFRVYMNTSFISGWIEVDSFGMIGSLEPSPRGLVTSGRYLLYQPDVDWYGEETFEYEVYDCASVTNRSSITITVIPVNDPPRPVVKSNNAVLLEKTNIILNATDPENDTMVWYITELPSYARLFDPVTDLQIGKSGIWEEYRLPGSVVQILAENTSQLEVKFKWRVEDSFLKSSADSEQVVMIQCPPGYQKPSLPPSFQNQSNIFPQEKCTICPSNTYSQMMNSRDCMPCRQGYKSEPGSSLCKKDIITVSDQSKNSIFVLSILSCLYVLAAIMGLFALKDMPPIRASNFSFCIMILLGGLSVCISALIRSLSDDYHCYLPPWFVAIGFSLSLCAIIVKNYHVYRMFASTNILVTHKVSFSQLFSFAVSGCIPNIVILILWESIDGGLRENVEEINNTFVKTCSSDNQWKYAVSLYVYNGVLIILCLAIAIITRNNRTEFNESKLLGLSIYNLTMCSVLAVVLHIILTSDPSLQFVVSQIFLLFGVVSTVTIFFGYKFYRCMMKPDPSKTKGMSTIQPSSPDDD